MGYERYDLRDSFLKIIDLKASELVRKVADSTSK